MKKKKILIFIFIFLISISFTSAFSFLDLFGLSFLKQNNQQDQPEEPSHILSSPSNQIELTLTNNLNIDRIQDPVTSGIPFPKGAVFSTDNLRLTDSGGQEVPAQFNVSSRWWEVPGSTWGDDSIRWLLVDFQADVPANTTNATYYLEYGVPHTLEPTNPVQITEDANYYYINNNILDIKINKNQFNLFDTVKLNNYELISFDPNNGLVVTDEFSNKYYSSKDNTTIFEIEENGSMRAVLKIEGSHRNDLGERLLDFTVRIHAYANKSFVRVFYTFYNRESIVIGSQSSYPPSP